VGLVLIWLGRPVRNPAEVVSLALGIGGFWLAMAGVIATAGAMQLDVEHRTARFPRLYATMLVVLGVGAVLALWLASRA
jgi:hypothetical protein